MGKKKRNADLDDELLGQEGGTAAGAGEGGTDNVATEETKRKHHHKDKSKTKGKKKKRNFNDGVTHVAIIDPNKQDDPEPGAINYSEMGVDTGYNPTDELTSLTGGHMSHAQRRKRQIRNIIVTIILLIALVGIVIAGVMLSFPATYSCYIKNGNYYVVKVDEPHVDNLDYAFVCAGYDKIININGSSFIVNDNELPQMTITYDNTHGAGTGVEEEITLMSASNCDDVGVRRRSVKECNTITFNKTFPADASGSPTATYDVYATIAHPKAPKPKVGNKKVPRECSSNSTKIITVIPSPTTTKVYPPFTCIGEDTSYKVSGHFFVNVKPSGMPTLDLCGRRISDGIKLDDCDEFGDIPGYEGADVCEDITFTTAGTECESVQESTISVTNPEPVLCHTPPDKAVTIAVAHKPTITNIVPSIICPAQGEVPIDIVGTDFIVMNTARPKISIDGSNVLDATANAGCRNVRSGVYMVRICENATVKVPTTIRKGSMDAESVPVGVMSPIKSCGTEVEYNIAVLPAPTFTSMVNKTVCAATSDLRVRASGNFVTEHGTPFAVAVGKDAKPSTVGTELHGCTQSVVNGVTFDRCTELEFSVPSGTSLGEHKVTIQGLCYAQMDAAFATLPAPEVTAVDITNICMVEDTPLVVTGSNFLVFHGLAPDVIFTTKETGKSYTVSGISVSAGECTNVSDTYSLCKKLEFTVPAKTLEVGTTTMVVRNGPADGCNCAGKAYTVAVVSKPSITAVTTDTCEDQNVEVSITGANFFAGISAVVFYNTATGAEYAGSTIASIVSSEIRVTVPANYLPAGSYVVRVENSPMDGCHTTSSGEAGTLTVHANTLAVLAAEPSVLVAGTTAKTVFTVYTRNFTDVPSYIELRSTDGAKTFRYESANIEHDEGDYTRFRVILTPDVTADAAGTVYSAVVLGSTTCPITAPGILKVAPNDSFTITSVSPRTIPIAAGNADSNKAPIIVSAAEGTFASDVLPKAFFVGPSSTVARSNAQNTLNQIEDVFYVSSGQLRMGIATADLEEGAYDLYVTFEMSDGTTAGTVLAGAFTASGIINAPTITGATRTVYRGAYSTIEVDGTNFGASEHYNASLICSSKTFRTENITVDSTTHMLIGFKIPSTTNPCVCTLEVTDTEHGFAVKFPGISIVLKSRKISSWETVDLPTAVCAPTAAAYDFGLGDIDYGCCSSGLCTNRSFIYLIGGDEDKGCKGVAPSANVYFTPTNTHGVPTNEATWKLAAHLPTGIMHASAEVIGPYIYVVGGLEKDNNIRDTVLRAHVLQPSEAPVLAGVQRITTETGTITSITPGSYYYAVAAVYAADDACNPGGDSLPSNVYSVYVATKYSRIELSWDTVEDAASYKVYRTATPGLLPTQMVLLATVDGSTYKYVDAGADTPNEKVTPMTLGAIGNWATLSDTLKSPRYGHTTATTRTSSVDYLFAFGGFKSTDSTQAPHYETVKVTTTSPSSTHGRTKHTLNGWSLGEREDFPSRSFWRASVLDNTNFGLGVNYTSAIVLGGSSESTTEYVSDYVYNGKSLLMETPTTVSTSVSAFGYCQFVLDDFLYNIGGTNETGSLGPLPGSASSSYMHLA